MNKNYFFIQNRDDFHKRRKTTIGSSDIPVLFGLSNYKTPYELWKEMTGRYKANGSDDKNDNVAADLGHEIEGVILSREIADIAGKELAHEFKIDYYKHEDSRPKVWKTATAFKPFAVFIHADDKRFAASPDCIVSVDDWQESWTTAWKNEKRNITIEYPSDPHARIIEAKLGSRYANIKSPRLHDGYDLDDPSENGLPMRVYLQCQWQSFVTGIQHITVRALLDSVFESRHSFEANPKIQQKLAEFAEKFLWYVENDKEPAPMNQNDVFDIYDDVQNEVMVIGGKQAKEAEELLFQKQKWESVGKEAKKKISEIKNALGIMMGEKQYLSTARGKDIAKQVISQPAWSTIGVQRIYDQCPEAFELLEVQGLIPEKKGRRYIK